MHPGDHIKITKKAIKLYLARAERSHSRSFGEYEGSIVRGCVIEDIFPLHERLTKWHFYPENKALKPGRRKVMGVMLSVDPTSKQLCDDRVERLEREIEAGPSRKLFRLVGRVLHHVQDMSTPAHVVPVYHDPIAPDSYESYSRKHTEERLRSVDVSRDRFSALQSDLGGPFDLYDNGAQATLAYLYESERRFSRLVDGKKDEFTCDEFWKRSSGKGAGAEVRGGQGFGGYGLLGRHFGKTRLKVSGNVHEVAADVFRTLHQDLVQKAVDDSLKVLMFAEARMNRS